MKKPTVVIVAGGNNSRFAPLNTRTHKGFLSLNGKPIVVRTLENLQDYGFSEVVLVVSRKDYDNQGLAKYLATYNLKLKIKLILQEEARGMGEALLLAKEYLDDYFVLAAPYHLKLGEVINQLLKKQQLSNANFVLSCSTTNNPSLYGVLKFDVNDKQKIVAIVEKPHKGEEPSNIKLNSIYLLHSSFLTELEKANKTEYSLEKTLNNYCQSQTGSYIVNQTKSLKYPWHLFPILTDIFASSSSYYSKTAQVSRTAILDDSSGPIIIDDQAQINDFVKIVGPCYIGKNSFIGDYSFIRGSSIQENVVVGANSEIIRSILFANTSMHYGYLADSIIGHSTKIGAGLITANKRLDRKNIRVKVKTKLVDVGSNRLGIIVGENSSIGIRVSTMPGITIAANSSVLPNKVIKRNVS